MTNDEIIETLEDDENDEKGEQIMKIKRWKHKENVGNNET